MRVADVRFISMAALVVDVYTKRLIHNGLEQCARVSVCLCVRVRVCMCVCVLSLCVCVWVCMFLQRIFESDGAAFFQRVANKSWQRSPIKLLCSE